MAYLAHARDLRSLLSLAAKLRVLARETLAKGDEVVYLMAAEALEKRAAWLSATLPDDHDEQDKDMAWRHRPVDIFV